MESLSNIIFPAASSPADTARVKDPSPLPPSEKETGDRPLKPAMDQYIPEEPREPAGRYWLGKDEDGRLHIHFDDPERAEESPKDEGSERKPAGPQEERVTGSTDQVDREIERLKKEKEELERQIHAASDPQKAKELEKKLAQVERELRQKDNDAYRRQHTSFSFG